jgi:hypothetical protein
LWEQLILALIGDAFSEVGDDEVTGITLSVKNGEDVLSVWNRHGKDGRKGLGIKRILKDIVGASVNWEYSVFEEIKEKERGPNGNAEKAEKWVITYFLVNSSVVAFVLFLGRASERVTWDWIATLFPSFVVV